MPGATFPRAELERALGSRVVAATRVASGGYGTNSAHWRAELDDGRRVFVKVALDAAAAEWLRAEHRVYGSVRARFLASFAGWCDDGDSETFLVLEELGDAYWPPPWSRVQIDAVFAALDDLHGTPPPAGLRALADLRERLDGWPDVVRDPAPLLRTGLCSASWLNAALPELAAASAGCDLAGGAFLHLDVRSDNLCFRGTQAILVDWNLACVGNPLIDAVAWLPSLRLEGGPEPWELVPDSEGFAALLAGFFASRAGLPPPETAPMVREFQARQAAVALAWAARELGLPLPKARG